MRNRSFASTVERTTAAYPEYWEYPLWAFGILPVGVVMCARVVEHDEVAFSDLSVAVPWPERLAQ